MPIDAPDALGQKRREAEGETTLMLHNVPEAIKARFKAACSMKELTMREVLLAFMDKYGEVHLKPKPRS